MCVAIPAKILKTDGEEALVDIEGVTRKVSLMLVDNASEGDYVILHAGFAITVVDECEAEKSLALLREMFAGTQER